MSLFEAGENEMLDHLGSVATHMSLHTGYPATLANEVTDASYSRQVITFDGAVGGVIEMSSQPQFSLEAGTTIVAIGFCDALTSGNILADDEITSKTFDSDGDYLVTTGTITLRSD